MFLSQLIVNYGVGMTSNFTKQIQNFICDFSPVYTIFFCFFDQILEKVCFLVFTAWFYL